MVFLIGEDPPNTGQQQKTTSARRSQFISFIILKNTFFVLISPIDSLLQAIIFVFSGLFSNAIRFAIFK